MKSLHLSALLSIALSSAGVCGEPELPPATVLEMRQSAVEVLAGGRLRGGGSFVKADDDVLVVTAAHLFNPHRFDVEVMIAGGERFAAEVIGIDLGHDLALLKVPGIDPKKIIARTIAEDTPGVTETIFIQAPALRRRVLTLTGKVADSRNCFSDFDASRGYLEHYFVSALTPNLTSGGVWMNRELEIVGVQNGRLNGEENRTSGLSLVAPPHAIRALVEKRKIFSTPTIGGWVWEFWTADDNYLAKLPDDLETGLLISRVEKVGPLAKAGVERLEIITACDGETFKRRHELIELLWAKPAGAEFELEIFNPDSKENRTVKIKTDVAEAAWHQLAKERKQ